MSRRFDFRNDCDVASSSIGDDVAHFVLRIKTAIQTRLTRGRIDIGTCGGSRRYAPGTYTSELRIPFDLQPPCLIVGEMPMQDVKFMQRHPVDELFDELR